MNRLVESSREIERTLFWYLKKIGKWPIPYTVSITIFGKTLDDAKRHDLNKM